MLDRNKTESIAVTAVKSAFSQVPGVLDSINTEDKVPFVDGYLAVYEGSTDHKDDLIGNIDVQVKGRSSKQIKSNKPKFRIAITDLRTYQNAYHGVLYFLVSVGNDYKPKGIYYRQLLSYDIAKILKTVKDDGSKTVSVRFRPLPEDDPFFLRKICLEFLDNRNKQHDVNCVRINQDDGLDEPIQFDRYELGKMISDSRDPVSLRTWSGESYLYGITGTGQYFTLDKIEDVVGIGIIRETVVSADDCSCSVCATLGEDEKGYFFKFGAFEFRFNPGASISYTPHGGFADRLRDARLMRGILRAQSLMVDGEQLFRGIAFKGNPIEDIEANIQSLEHYERLSAKLHLKKNWDPVELTDYELSVLDRLTEAIVYSKPVPLAGVDGDLVNLNMEVQGSRIKVLAKRNAEGLYDLIDPLYGGLIAYVPGIDNEGECDPKNGVPGFFILNRDDYIRAVNLDSEELKKSFEVLPVTELKVPFLNYKLLEMLSAYDEGAVCGKQLLECADLVATQLLSLEPDSEINSINSMQIKKRAGDIPDCMLDELRRLAMESKDDMVRASAYLLLGQHDFANDILKTLPESSREEFNNWPIARFVQMGTS